ncbi:hypothetical protein BCR37DRAFT_378770 [Protomyces lactucae-debilis]|uniref:Ubiquitin-like domain-containing protein n=1 Tax=Protomyces lactucae-debilis TaxID=2754530 RepID=A0A1Y2FIM4_PROLT|nr:uncharacterized protein BCR37DRAFT_378770 [Protomyces lactucae-debilis]ORY83789.1 hypothetical protein BCR37DRAFT_378770 [Protomyces lactucae-debilis]
MSVAGIDRAAQQVGFRRAQERYSDVQALKLVSLEARCIDTLDEVDLPCCEDFDLSCNLIDDLDCVARLCLSLPRLKCLRLAGNRFRQLETREVTVETLHLGDTMLSWDDILILCTRWHVKHLFLEHNELQDPAANLKTAPEVQSVELTGNSITDVHSITRVFPSLESLSLTGNQVAAISSVTLSHPLRRLALQDNPLPVDALSALPYQLIELSMTQLADPDADLARRLDILKHLPSLQVLNKTRITAQERQDALAVAAPKRDAMLLAHDVLNLTLAWEEDMVEVRVLKSQTVLQMRNLVKHICGVRPSSTLQDDATLDSLGLESGGRLLFHIHG